MLAQQLEDKDKQEEEARKKKREEDEKHQRQILMAKTQGKMEADAELGKTIEIDLIILPHIDSGFLIYICHFLTDIIIARLLREGGISCSIGSIKSNSPGRCSQRKSQFERNRGILLHY